MSAFMLFYGFLGLIREVFAAQCCFSLRDVAMEFPGNSQWAIIVAASLLQGVAIVCTLQQRCKTALQH